MSPALVRQYVALNLTPRDCTLPPGMRRPADEWEGSPA
jgi:hypothetical protein